MNEEIKEWDEGCPECGAYGEHSNYDCKIRHIKNLENGDLTEEEKERKLKYCETRCTSRCGKDFDCPHEENFESLLIDNLEK